MPERLLIAMIFIPVLVALYVALAFIIRRQVDQLPANRRAPAFGISAVLFAAFPLPQAWYYTHVLGEPTTYEDVLLSQWPLYVAFAAGWLWSFLARRRREREATPVQEEGAR